jgi:hypothetical protein
MQALVILHEEAVRLTTQQRTPQYTWARAVRTHVLLLQQRLSLAVNMSRALQYKSS